MAPMPVPDTFRTATSSRSPSTDELHVAEDGRWFLAQGKLVDLSRRPTLARILAALATSPEPLKGWALIEIGWPNEKIIASAAKIRIRVAIATLRTLGLMPYLVSRQPGYALSCTIIQHRAGEEGAAFAAA